jgi:hypothetical protein
MSKRLGEENERLREEVEDCEAVLESVAEYSFHQEETINRLRGLLEECKPYLDGYVDEAEIVRTKDATRACELYDKIEKEVGDER